MKIPACSLLIGYQYITNRYPLLMLYRPHGWLVYTYPPIQLIVVYIWHTHALPISPLSTSCTLHVCHQPHSLSCSIILQSPSPVYVHRHRTLFHIYSPPTAHWTSLTLQNLSMHLLIFLPICIIMQLPSILTHLRSTHTPIIFSYTNLLQLFQYYITGRSAPSAPTVVGDILLYPRRLWRMFIAYCCVYYCQYSVFVHYYVSWLGCTLQRWCTPIEAVLDLCTKNCG